MTHSSSGSPSPPSPVPAAPRPDTSPAQPETLLPSGPPPSRLALETGAQPVAGYTLVRLLGTGGFGEVWEATGPGGIRVALKFIRLDAAAGAVEQRALDLVKEVSHPNLLVISGAWQQSGYLI